MPTHRFLVVDVFTDTALAGNQLAVFTDARGIEAETMQALALEIGFSETTFVLPPEAGGTARVRIFNPDHEMQFAGHPVLGTAWALAQPLQRGVVELETGSGIVPVEIDRDESGALVFGRMQQPIPDDRAVLDEQRVCSRSARPRALGVPGRAVRQRRDAHRRDASERGRRRCARTGLGRDRVVRRYGSQLRRRRRARAGRPACSGTRGEDAATGSAAGPIACHLSRHGRVEWGEWIEISQGAEIGRPSTLFARADGAGGEIVSVFCGGRAVVVARGEFRL